MNKTATHQVASRRLQAKSKLSKLHSHAAPNRQQTVGTRFKEVLQKDIEWITIVESHIKIFSDSRLRTIGQIKNDFELIDKVLCETRSTQRALLEKRERWYRYAGQNQEIQVRA